MEYFRQVIGTFDLLRFPHMTHRSTNNKLFIHTSLFKYTLHYGPDHIYMTTLENADPFFKYTVYLFSSSVLEPAGNTQEQNDISTKSCQSCG